jgi:hypothetical protein
VPPVGVCLAAIDFAHRQSRHFVLYPGAQSRRGRGTTDA